MPVGAVDRVLLRDRVQQLAVGRDRERARDGVHPVDVGAHDLVAGHGDDPLARHGAHVLAGDAGEHRLGARARHALGLLDGRAHRARRLLDVGHRAAAQPGGARLGDAEHAHAGAPRRAAHRLGDDRRGARGADVERHHQPFRLHALLAGCAGRRAGGRVRAPPGARDGGADAAPGRRASPDTTSGGRAAPSRQPRDHLVAETQVQLRGRTPRRARSRSTSAASANRGAVTSSAERTTGDAAPRCGVRRRARGGCGASANTSSARAPRTRRASLTRAYT
jgi:hypothetical protein